MDAKQVLDDIQMSYAHMADDISREIFANRLLYNLSGDEDFNGNDEQYLYRIYSRVGTPFNQAKQYYSHSVIIFGTGQWGKRIGKILTRLHISCYTDNNAWGGDIGGIPIIPFAEMIEKYQQECIIVSSTKYCDEMIQQLLVAGIPKDNIWPLGKDIKNWQETVCQRQYFDLPVLPHEANEFFVDAGGFDGETSLAFCRWCNGNYKQIYVFEPNASMYQTCKANLADVKNCEIFPYGLWKNSGAVTCYEDSLHQMKLIDLSRDIIGTAEIPTTSIDESLQNQDVTFIKMDIEGAEMEALQGAENTIKKLKPKLAISVYHKKSDLWEIPKLILSYRPDYKLYLRHYTFSRYETILYAV